MLSLIAVIVVCVAVTVALYVNNSPSSSQTISALSDFPTMTIGSQYLSRPPYFPDNSTKTTKIFLESATLRYDYSNVSFTSDSGYDEREGVPAVVINATIRNDYTVEEIIQFLQVGVSDCVVGIDVYMYDNAGDFVGTLHQGDPFRGCYTLSMKSGETVTVNMVFATPNRSIDHFEIYVSYIQAA
ncbi:MAG: hypothetical protein CW716_07825 [Candidatus Bathyarchaeum sp.]|nr:MAG: hypothetical protein CW716_07825 [Candidatus Bathyarchaeum sp.]